MMIRPEEIHILIVDDTPANLALAKQILQREGYQVNTAQGGEQAVDIAFKGGIDLILLDVMMPVVNGYDVMTRLQTDSQARKIPVIFVTAKAETDDVILGLEMGAKDYITKPLTAALLKLRVRNLLELTQANRQLQKVVSDLTREIILRTEVEIDLRAKKHLLQQAAMLDGLTQIANRRHLDERMDQTWRHMKRIGGSLALIMCDIDYFKNFNDTYGHQAGDVCLQKVAKVLAQAARRPVDLAARFGGEEFVILLPETSAEGALHIAQEIKASLANLAIEHSASKVNPFVTLSMGIFALVPDEGHSPKTLVEMADKALYMAKNNGRNGICRCNEQGFFDAPDPDR